MIITGFPDSLRLEAACAALLVDFQVNSIAKSLQNVGGHIETGQIGCVVRPPKAFESPNEALQLTAQ